MFAGTAAHKDGTSKYDEGRFETRHCCIARTDGGWEQEDRLVSERCSDARQQAGFGSRHEPSHLEGLEWVLRLHVAVDDGVLLQRSVRNDAPSGAGADEAGG